MYRNYVRLCFITLMVTCDLLLYSEAADTTTLSPETTSVSNAEESTTLSTTSLPVTPTCDNLSVMENIDTDRISGTWYELARKDYPVFQQDLICINMNISAHNGTASVYQTFAMATNIMNVETRYFYLVLYNVTNTSDYSIYYSSYDYIPTPIYKILDTDYENYLVVCSYFPVWQNSAAAFVYFRDRSTPDTEVYSVIDNAAAKYVDFTGLNLVYQGPRCNAVSRVLPMGGMLFMLLAFYSLKFMEKL